MDLLWRHALTQQIPIAVYGSSEKQVGDLVGDQAVNFLRHGAIKRAQSGFNMFHGD
jgi:hypothetical protein